MRTEKSLKNVTIALLGQGMFYILSFILRTIFIKTLGNEYLGINGIFTNILSIISIVELGFGAAITIFLYKPIADNDIEEIAKLKNFYKKVYTTIGMIIFLISILIIPFLPIIIKDVSSEVERQLTSVYIIFILNSIISYFFIHYKSIIEAKQEKYIVTLIHYFSNIILLMIQACILILYKNFILYMVVQLISTIIENIIISILARKRYKEIFNIQLTEIEKHKKKEIFNKTKSMSCQLLGNVVLNGTDNIVMSVMVGVNWVGLYSNYYLILSVIENFATQIFAAIQASIGNLNVSEDKKKKYEIYKKLDFINFWIATFCSISYGIIINTFVEFWVGKEYILPNLVVLFITINLYLQLSNKINTIYKYASGIVEKDKYASLIGAIINIILSIILTKWIGVIGIFIGTTIALLTTQIFVEPYILYKYIFKQSYFLKVKSYIIRILIAAGLGIILLKMTELVTVQSQITKIIVSIIMCTIVINVVIMFLYRKKEEMQFVKNIIKSLNKRRLKRNV